MAGKIKVPSELIPSQSNKVMLRSKYIYDDVKGHTQEEVNAALEEQIKSKVIEAGGVNWDTVPTANSNNAVKSKDIKAALEKVTGYFVLDSNVTESTVAKTVTVADFPALAIGGSIKIKMTTKNTAANPTLRIGASNAPAYPLYYNNEIASANNSWEANEVISVYFDGTNYKASNAQGGGGKADLRNIGLLNVYFYGIGTTYATSDKFYGVAGHILKFTLVEQNVPYDSIASAQSRFMIYSHDANDVETTLYRVNGTNLPDKEIVVCVPNDSVCLYIGGRCSRGYKYECKVVDISYDYKDTSITINDLYYHLLDNKEYNYRINLLLPYQNNAVVKIHPKISAPTHQYEIDGVVINDDKTTTSTILINYSNTQIDYVFKGGYSYIIVFFKNGNNLEVDKSELLSEYDINVEYPETIEELKITDGENKWNLIGLSKISNQEAKTDFIVFPNLPMKVRVDIPMWMKVSFTTGNRTNRVDLGTYYSGDIVDFSQGSAGVFVDFKRLDDRGFDADFYNRHSKFLGMSLTQIGSNDGNIFERNYDNEKNLGGIMATGLQELQRFPTIVHVSDAHGDSFRLNAAHDYADYILADLVINTGDNPFFEMTDGVNFVKDIVFSHKTDFANCIGNHDQYTSTLADVFSKNISPFATEYGYHKSTSSDVTDKCYYFKDLSAQKIRLIVLDVYDGLRYQAYKARISQEQINWFVNTLAATPQDYGVIVVSHQAPHTINAISGKENFNDVTMEPQINALDSDYMKNGKITGNPLGKIIDAFIVKGSVSGSYTQKKATSSTNETISYSADFSNVASGVEFIAYINGHTHRDFIGYVADCENNQLNCNVCSTSPLSQTTGYGDKSDIYRDANGVAQDAFNVYTIDRYNHRVGVCRIGSNLSLNLIDRKVMWFDYR